MFKTCPKCTTQNHPGSAFCQNCKEPLGTVPVKAVSGTSPAGFWIRLAAYLADQFILYVVFLLILVFLDLAGVIALSKVAAINPYDLKFNALGVLISGAYFTMFTGIEGQTFGKRLFGIRVLRFDGRRVTYTRSLLRYLAYFVSVLSFGVGFLVIGFTPDKRAWHDYLCDTVVVKVK